MMTQLIQYLLGTTEPALYIYMWHHGSKNPNHLALHSILHCLAHSLHFPDKTAEEREAEVLLKATHLASKLENLHMNPTLPDFFSCFYHITPHFPYCLEKIVWWKYIVKWKKESAGQCIKSPQGGKKCVSKINICMFIKSMAYFCKLSKTNSGMWGAEGHKEKLILHFIFRGVS